MPSEATTRGAKSGDEWPVDRHSEEVVLGNAVSNWPKVREHIGPDLFWDKSHRRIFGAALELELRGEPVDKVTIARQLLSNGLEGEGDIGVLAELDSAPVFGLQLERYIQKLDNVRVLRETALAAQAITTECLINGADIREIERRVQKLSGIVAERGQHERDAVVNEIPLTLGYGDSITYLVEDLLLDRAVTMWSGESGDGKSTLALKLAACVASGEPFLGRRTVQRPVVYMDRENPVAIINERLARLGVPPDLQTSGLLRIWGMWWRGHYPLGPDAAPIIAHARRVKPLFVWNSLIGFANCDENSSSEMRRHTSHYRHLASLEASNLVIHHRSEKGEALYRGSTDIKANMDLSWEVARDDNTNAADALGRMRLTPYKTRNHPGKAIRIEYKNGIFVPLDAPARPPMDIVVDLVRSHPGANQKEMKKLGPTMGLAEHPTVAAIEEAIQNRRLIPRRSKHNVIRYYLPEDGLFSSAQAKN